ncbi:MAG: TolC family protein [Bacteroidetes bacterium]|nr:TolC family protein [Bacteroidota bacterium]
MKKTILIILLLVAGIFAVKSQQVFNCDSLSIFRVLQSGLETNFDIRLKKQILGESQGRLTSTKGAFNPQLSLSTYGFYGTDPTVTFQDSYSLNGQLLVPTRLGIKFYTGFKLSTETEIISGVPGYFPSTNMAINASGMWAGVTMPLLRDLGRNNTNNVTFLSTMMMNKAQNVSFTDEICQFIKNTLIDYYSVYQRVKIYRIQSAAEKDAKVYLKDVEQMIADEQIPKAEVYRAKSYQFNISQQFTEAKNQLTNSLFDLITSIGMKWTLSRTHFPLFLDSLPDPASFPWAQYAAYVLKNADSMIVNTHYYKSQELTTSATQIEMKGAKYNKINDLNLDLRYMYFGTTSYQPFSEFNQTFSSGSPGSSLNLTLSYKIPFKNEERKGDYITKLSSYEFNKIQLEKLKFDSKMKVIQLLSDLGHLFPLYKNQVELAILEKKTYDNEVQKLKMATSTQINVINTYMDYNTALVYVETGRQAIIARIITLKYLIGDFPASSDQLLRYNLWDFSVK